MNIDGKKIWQQASGDGNRNYSDICVEWDVILNGPGEAGKFPDCIEGISYRSSKKITDLRRFCQAIQPGDIVVLRAGTNCVYTVGEVVGEYEWLEEFSDVDGWDLQHARRVRWLWHSITQPKTFDTYSLKFGDTTQEINPESPVVNWIKELEISESQFTRDLIKLRKLKKTDYTEENEIAEYLFDKGVANNAIENLIKEFKELTRIAKWYRQYQQPSERETVTYLVVPLLRALGWTPQKMAVEWNGVDLALFEKLPRSNESLSVVVEAKKIGYSCLSAKSQAESYAINESNCKRLIVTDGIRYGVYLQIQDMFMLYAYMNLTEFRDEYPIYNAHGILEALRAMNPDWNDPIPYQ